MGIAFLLLSHGTACGGSDSVTSTDGGNPTDGGGHASDATATDEMSSADSQGSSDGESADSESDAENGNTLDGEGTATAAVDLGTAGDYAILAKTGISTVPTSAVTGNIGVSPAAATYITGFSLVADATNVFSRSPQVTGKIYAADYAVPTPANLTTAIGDMLVAFTNAAGRAPDVSGLGAGNIGGMTLKAGVYKWGTGLLIPTDVTLAGNATDVWIFQIAKNLTVSNATNIALTGGAVAKHVFWQVAGFASLGTTAHFEGIILAKTMISLGTGATITGSLLAQTEVSIESSTVVEPAM
jgi:hypothetical protein